MRLHSRRLAAAVAIGLATLALPAAALAHATMSPPVAEPHVLQQFTLSVPTEKEGATTTAVELTVPAGFAVDSFEAEPGWKRSSSTAGSGGNAVVQTVTWTGGATPTEEDSVFRFNAEVDAAKTYTFSVKQTYSDGSIVTWNGAESSDTPAPQVVGVSSIGGGSSSNALGITAVVLGVVAVLAAMIALIMAVGRRRPMA